MTNADLIKKLNQVPENFIQSVTDYVDYILEKAKREANNEHGEKRKLGALKGKLKIADDFNAPLDDFKDYM